MKTTISLVCALVTCIGTGAFAQNTTKPAPATQILASAQKRAAKEKKAVFVVFHASWCGWCHRLEDSINKPPFKKLFADNYVIVSLDVREHGDKKVLENPGADKVMADLGGTDAGLPFYAFTDARGTRLASSLALPASGGKMANIGYPTTPAEIAAFDSLLRKTAPKMNAKARQSYLDYLKSPAK